MKEDDLSRLKLLLHQKRRLLEAAKREPLLLYRPHRGEGYPRPDGSLPGGQDAFHRSTARIRGVFCGNRWGKSMCGAAEDAAFLLGSRLWYSKDDPAYHFTNPPKRLLVLTTDWDIVRDVWTDETKPGKLFGFLRNHIDHVSRTPTGVINKIFLKNGSSVHFETERAFKQDRQSAESRDWDAIHVDEPVCKPMFTAHARGLMDRGGMAWFTLTAIREPWIVDLCKEDGSWYYEGSTYENPHLSKEAIAEFERLLSPEERECRLFGKPLHMAGLVYKSFDPAYHLLSSPPPGWRSLTDPPPDHLIYVAIDPHPQTPTAVLFCAVGPDGVRHYYFDLFSRLLVSEVAEAIREHCRGRRLAKVKIDPAAFIRDPISGRNTVLEFKRCGVIATKAKKNLGMGIMKVNQVLAKHEIVFHSTAARTIWEIQRYCWEPDGSNRPVDRDDHMMENLYRLELEQPAWYPRSEGAEVEEWEDFDSFDTSEPLDLEPIEL
jgi:hypothetical protein